MASSRGYSALDQVYVQNQCKMTAKVHGLHLSDGMALVTNKIPQKTNKKKRNTNIEAILYHILVEANTAVAYHPWSK